LPQGGGKKEDLAPPQFGPWKSRSPGKRKKSPPPSPMVPRETREASTGQGIGGDSRRNPPPRPTAAPQLGRPNGRPQSSKTLLRGDAVPAQAPAPAFGKRPRGGRRKASPRFPIARCHHPSLALPRRKFRPWGGAVGKASLARSSSGPHGPRDHLIPHRGPPESHASPKGGTAAWPQIGASAKEGQTSP